MEPKSKIVGVRMSQRMFTLVEAMCTDLGVDPQDLIRGLLLDKIENWKKRAGRPPAQKEERETEK